jgi:hypothetical protein
VWELVKELCNKKQYSHQAVDNIWEIYILKQCGDNKYNVNDLPVLSIDLLTGKAGAVSYLTVR